MQIFGKIAFKLLISDVQASCVKGQFSGGDSLSTVLCGKGQVTLSFTGVRKYIPWLLLSSINKRACAVRADDSVPQLSLAGER